jgi:hypothetical protein
VVFRTDGDPPVASIAQDTLSVELADLGVFREHFISLFEGASILVVTGGP